MRSDKTEEELLEDGTETRVPERVVRKVIRRRRLTLLGRAFICGVIGLLGQPDHRRFAQGIMFDHTVPLRKLLLKPVTQQRYTHALTNFYSWCRENCVSFHNAEQCDDSLELYLNDLYMKNYGRRRQVGIDTFSGLIWRFPQWKGKLMASQVALKSWAKAAPYRSYLPITWGVALCVAWSLWCAGEQETARAIILSHSGLLRVGELLRLCAQDVTFFKDKGAVLRVREGKTGKDQLVRISCPWVVKILKKMVELAKIRDPESNVLVGLSYDMLRRRLRNGLRAVGLYESRYTWHSLRHGGATQLALKGEPLDSISLKGRWKAISNAVRYVQLGMALLTETRLSSRWQQRAEFLEEVWMRYMV